MCDVEILCLAEQLGFSVKECGIRWRDDGDSRLALVRGNLQNVYDLLRIRIGQFRIGRQPRRPIVRVVERHIPEKLAS